MKRKLLVFIPALIHLSVIVFAQNNIPPDAEKFYQRAMNEISPVHVTWVKNTAARVNNQNLDSVHVRNLAADYIKSLRLAEGDIMAITFLVMMEAAKSASEDLKMIMARVKSINKKKEELRQAQQQLEQNKNNITRKDLDSFRSVASPGDVASIAKSPRDVASRPAASNTTLRPVTPSQKTNTDSLKKIRATGLATVNEVNEVKETVKNKLDSMSEMGEMESLKLQMIMDRRSKFISTLSNIMKKISTTQDTLVQNLK